ncbi:protein MNN4-like [Teleopsis dalmanni]|uniref:protein MNN4-like n=1 Tax=Teleopsis dalmanni TaxID=139649 RepID=UPI0018CE0528|nr:protein MNN4-like [Teleopsis dalmanni]XP_037928296.1 protein MNN4-like [Teleopsis dalmanni]XP_037928297.1 protein MNN4-like [Teleopsis dalmanni]
MILYKDSYQIMPSESDTRNRSVPHRITHKLTDQKPDNERVVGKRALPKTCAAYKKRKVCCDGEKSTLNEPSKNSAKKRKWKDEMDTVHTAKRKCRAKSLEEQTLLEANRNLDETNKQEMKQETSFCDCKKIKERKEDFSTTVKNQNMDETDKKKRVKKIPKNRVVHSDYKKKLRPRVPVINQKDNGDAQELKKNKHEEMKVKREQDRKKKGELKKSVKAKHEKAKRGRKNKKKRNEGKGKEKIEGEQERKNEEQKETTREGKSETTTLYIIKLTTTKRVP